MMKVKLTYMDGKDLEVNIAPEDAKKFFDAVGHHQFYFDDRKGRGFWTDVDKIRFMQVEELPDAEKRNAILNAPDAGAEKTGPGDRVPEAETQAEDGSDRRDAEPSECDAVAEGEPEQERVEDGQDGNPLDEGKEKAQ